MKKSNLEILDSSYDYADLECVVLVDNNVSISVPNSIEVDHNEFNYYLSAIIANHKNLVSQATSKNQFLQDFASKTVH